MAAQDMFLMIKIMMDTSVAMCEVDDKFGMYMADDKPAYFAYGDAHVGRHVFEYALAAGGDKGSFERALVAFIEEVVLKYTQYSLPCVKAGLDAMKKHNLFGESNHKYVQLCDNLYKAAELALERHKLTGESIINVTVTPEYVAEAHNGLLH